MRYIAELQYCDYDDAENMFLTFEGSNVELEIFKKKIKDACEHYKTVVAEKWKEKRALNPNYDNQKINQLMREIRDMQIIKIDGKIINFKFLFDDYNSNGQLTNYVLPEFITLEKFFIEKQEECTG